MKKLILLVTNLVALIQPIFANSNTIQAQNLSTAFAYLSRLDAAGNSVTLSPRSPVSSITLAQVTSEAATANGQMLLVNVYTNQSIIESSFSGFNGAFGQDCSITIAKDGNSVSITYPNSPNSNTNNTPATGATSSTSAASTGYQGSAGTSGSTGNSGNSGGVIGGGTTGTAGTQNNASSANNNNNSSSPSPSNTDPGPSKKKVLAGGTGVNIHLADPDNTFKPLDLPPAPKLAAAKPAAPAGSVTTTKPGTAAKSSSFTLWCVLLLIIAAIGYISFRVNQDKKKKAKTAKKK